MRQRKQIAYLAVALSLGLLALILINSGLGVDSEETITDLHRPEIVGENRSVEP